MEKNKTLLELYILVKERLQVLEITKCICNAIANLCFTKDLNHDEYILLDHDFMKRKPYGKKWNGFWFDNLEERIEFLESIIKELEYEK